MQYDCLACFVSGTRVLGRGSGLLKSGLMDCGGPPPGAGLQRMDYLIPRMYRRNRRPGVGVCLKQLSMTGFKGNGLDNLEGLSAHRYS